jgi:5-dehydro-2-deoxygluconokinase
MRNEFYSAWPVPMTEPQLVCIGRIAVDLYAEQAHTPLEEARTFRRYPGGSSANTAIAAARAGVKVGLISAVGDDPMGRYLLGELSREGVDRQAIVVHRSRRTALAFLGMLKSDAAGLDFYREQAADVEIASDAVPAGYLEKAKALAIIGTHVVDPIAWKRIAPIVERARGEGVPLILDIDLRRGLWEGFDGGLSGSVARLSAILPQCAMIVGNLEEIELILPDGAAAPPNAILIRKLGPDGAAWERRGDRIAVAGIPVDVVNPVGAGDAFLGNLLAAWISGKSREEALARANAAGALVATRHGCSSEMPYPAELDQFVIERDQASPKLAHLHRSLKRPPLTRKIAALACDHREPFRVLMKSHERSLADARRFKDLVFRAMQTVAPELENLQPGMLMDPVFGQDVLDQLGHDEIWTGRPIEVTGSRPLRVEAGYDLAAYIASWRRGQVAKVLVWHSPDDSDELAAAQIRTLHELQAACRAADIEWMLELVPPLDMPRADETLCRGVAQYYRAGLFPDWWKLPALSSASGWRVLSETISDNDPLNRGVMVLGLNETLGALSERLRLAGAQSICAGFAIGRTIFGETAENWFASEFDDLAAVKAMSDRYRALAKTFTEGGVSQ